MSFPGTLNYVAEFYTIIGFISSAPTLGFLTLGFFVLGLVLVSSYNLLMYVKVVYGPIISVNFKAASDLRLSETVSLIMWLLPIIGLGFYPATLLSLALDAAFVL